MKWPADLIAEFDAAFEVAVTLDRRWGKALDAEKIIEQPSIPYDDRI